MKITYICMILDQSFYNTNWLNTNLFHKKTFSIFKMSRVVIIALRGYNHLPPQGPLLPTSQTEQRREQRALRGKMGYNIHSLYRITIKLTSEQSIVFVLPQCWFSVQHSANTGETTWVCWGDIGNFDVREGLGLQLYHSVVNKKSIYLYLL